jgi:signal transduction histidine kinase
VAKPDEPHTVEQARAALINAEAALEHALGAEQKSVVRERQRLSELAHEINTPLNAMIGYTYIIAEELLGPLGNPKYLEQARIIYQASMHLQSICEDILSVASDIKTPEINLAEVNLSQLTDGIIKLFTGMAEERGVTLAAEIDNEFPQLRTDPRRLNQILINLVSNAIKFTLRGGSVIVQAETHPESGVMILVIADNGQGMAPDKLRDAIQPYQKDDSASPHGDSGSGLGLAIASRLTNEIQGGLLLKSEEGIGTIAAIEMPISYDSGHVENSGCTVILEGKGVLDFAPHRAIHKKD